MHMKTKLPARLFDEAREPGFPVVDIDDLDLPDDQLGQAIMTNYAVAQTTANEAMDRLVTVGRQLLVARLRSSNFRKFLRDHCKGLSPDWAYKLIAIGRGKGAQVRAKEKARKQRYLQKRAAATEAPAHSATDTTLTVESALGKFKAAVDTYFPSLDDGSHHAALDYVRNWKAA
jgi:hypothetical protein